MSARMEDLVVCSVTCPSGLADASFAEKEDGLYHREVGSWSEQRGDVFGERGNDIQESRTNATRKADAATNAA